MAESFGMVALARWQFAFTIAFHILFPALTIGLAGYLVLLESLWLATRRDLYLRLYDFWLKPFALTFGMGVVSGVVMTYQIGTNWSAFAEATGAVLGPLFGYEVLTAFFLEASFLGIMLFGRGRVGDGTHLLATVLVAVGTLISAFWILAANSWMQTPAGFELQGERFVPSDWREVIFNPSMPYRFSHMVLASYLSTAMVIAGVASYYHLTGRADEASATMLRMIFPFIAVAALIQMLVGHEHGGQVREHQPIKLAALEGHWHSYGPRAPFIVIAAPDSKMGDNRWELAIPVLGSLIVTHSIDGSFKGLDAWPETEWPPVAAVFWSFRLMVGLGILMLVVGAVGSWHLWRGGLTDRRGFLRLCVVVAPSGVLAVLAGWMTAELGRQPYLVQGLLRTAEAVSPVSARAVSLSLIVFLFAYCLIFGAGLYYLLRIVREGPGREEKPDLTAPEPRATTWADIDGDPRDD